MLGLNLDKYDNKLVKSRTLDDISDGMLSEAAGKGCVYNQNVESIILQTGGLSIHDQLSYSAGLFRLFKCIRT